VKYETPQLTALSFAINAIQSDVDGPPKVPGVYYLDNIMYLGEHISGYMDWED
jgi:hypothetical protein